GVDPPVGPGLVGPEEPPPPHPTRARSMDSPAQVRARNISTPPSGNEKHLTLPGWTGPVNGSSRGSVAGLPPVTLRAPADAGGPGSSRGAGQGGALTPPGARGCRPAARRPPRLAAVAALAVLPACGGDPPTATELPAPVSARPNIVLVLADDL